MDSPAPETQSFDSAEQTIGSASSVENVPPSPSASSKSSRSRSKKDFTFGDVLGEGSFGQVVIGAEIGSGKKYAVKIVSKQHIVQAKKVETIKREKMIMDGLNHPNIVKIFYTFQDPSHLYFVIELCEYGELLKFIRKNGALNEVCTSFYVAEIISALEYMKSKGVLHRDLKPENLLIGAGMHIKLTDFGSAKAISGPLVHQTGEGASESASSEQPDEEGKIGRANSFVGTADYVSPEVLGNKPASFSSDLWSLGCTIYHMLSGKAPFRSVNEYMTFQKILSLKYEFPDGFPEVGKDLVNRLLVIDPDQRLGGGESGMGELKSHPFFKGIDFEALQETTPPPFESSPALGLNSAAAASSPIDVASNILNQAEAQMNRSARLSLQQKQSPAAPYLEQNELILFEGTISKKRGLFSKKRYLVLTDLPRFFYVDLEKNEIKGEIPWVHELECTFKNTSHFLVDVPGRTYILHDPSGKARLWCEKIKEALDLWKAQQAS